MEQPHCNNSRFALANQCLPRNAPGQMVPKPKTPWRDGTRLRLLPALGGICPQSATNALA